MNKPSSYWWMTTPSICNCCMIPGIDGYETCSRLKSGAATCNSVVIFLTALQSSEEKVRVLSMGAMDFLTKPFDPEEILARGSLQIDNHRKHKALLEQNQQLAAELATRLQSGPHDGDLRADRVKSFISGGESNRVSLNPPCAGILKPIVRKKSSRRLGSNPLRLF